MVGGEGSGRLEWMDRHMDEQTFVILESLLRLKSVEIYTNISE